MSHPSEDRYNLTVPGKSTLRGRLIILGQTVAHAILLAESSDKDLEKQACFCRLARVLVDSPGEAAERFVYAVCSDPSITNDSTDEEILAVLNKVFPAVAGWDRGVLALSEKRRIETEAMLEQAMSAEQALKTSTELARQQSAELSRKQAQAEQALQSLKSQQDAAVKHEEAIKAEAAPEPVAPTLPPPAPVDPPQTPAEPRGAFPEERTPGATFGGV